MSLLSSGVRSRLSQRTSRIRSRRLFLSWFEEMELEDGDATSSEVPFSRVFPDMVAVWRKRYRNWVSTRCQELILKYFSGTYLWTTLCHSRSFSIELHPILALWNINLYCNMRCNFKSGTGKGCMHPSLFTGGSACSALEPLLLEDCVFSVFGSLSGNNTIDIIKA